MKNVLRAIILGTVCVATGPVFAEARALPLPTDTRLVQFVYQPNNMYTILTRPESITNIQLSDDEDLVTFATGDTVQWMVSYEPGHIFIKPLFPNLNTNGTLVTTKRIYQLTLRSGPLDGKFYQQVIWQNPQLIAYRQERAVQHRAMLETEQKFAEARRAQTVVSSDVALEKLSFEYEIMGKASFAPTNVFDDGKFTWIRLPQTQEMPAVFMLDGDNVELLNFTIRDNFIVIQRLVPGVLLKLGEKEVRIVKKKERTGWFSSSRDDSAFGFGGR